MRRALAVVVRRPSRLSSQSLRLLLRVQEKPELVADNLTLLLTNLLGLPLHGLPHLGRDTYPDKFRVAGFTLSYRSRSLWI